MNFDQLPEPLLAVAAAVDLAVFDVDGVMTDGRLLIHHDGTESKSFHTRDGLGLKALMRRGIDVAVITARRSTVVDRRMAELGIAHYCQGQEDKRAALDKLWSELERQPYHTAYMGDDLVDWPAMKACGLKAAPADAAPWITARCDFVSNRPGGYGAVRELCELLLHARGALESWQGGYA